MEKWNKRSVFGSVIGVLLLVPTCINDAADLPDSIDRVCSWKVWEWSHLRWAFPALGLAIATWAHWPKIATRLPAQFRRAKAPNDFARRVHLDYPWPNVERDIDGFVGCTIKVFNGSERPIRARVAKHLVLYGDRLPKKAVVSIPDILPAFSAVELRIQVYIDTDIARDIERGELRDLKFGEVYIELRDGTDVAKLAIPDGIWIKRADAWDCGRVQLAQARG